MSLRDELNEIKSMLLVLIERQQVREFYEVEQFAMLVGKSSFTIREHCRLGRLNGKKRESGRGAHAQWVLSHAELLRFQREGLLPIRKPAS